MVHPIGKLTSRDRLREGVHSTTLRARVRASIALVFVVVLLASASGTGNPSSRAGDRERRFKLSVTVDFFGDGGQGLYTRETLGLMMRQIKDVGAERVYWQYLGEPDQETYGAGTNLLLSREAPFGSRTLAALGEPLQAAVTAAHRHGLEIFGELKPYDTGMSATFPEGSLDYDPSGKLARIGGSLQSFNPFLARFPHTRIKRFPVKAPRDLESISIRRIRLLKKDVSPTRLRRKDLEIWTSANNYQYRRKPVEFTLREGVEPAPREIRDYYGTLVTPKGAIVRTLTLEGLNLPDKYILITTSFTAGSPDFENTAVGMIEAFGPGPEPLPIVVATQDATWTRPRDFRGYGLEFDSGYGRRRMFLDAPRRTAELRPNQRVKEEEWRKARAELGLSAGGGFIALARGKNEYLPAAPCEAYPEVQKLWLWRLDRMLQKAVDGVVLRVSAHGTLTDEPEAYGFNEPVVAAYRRRFGIDPLRSSYDPQLLAKVRGEFYTDFVREASRRTREAGKLFQVQVHTEAFRPDPVHGQIMGFPANMEFAWSEWLREGLADAVTLRASWYEGAEDPLDGSPTNRSNLGNVLSDPVVRDVLDVTRTLNVPVYMNRYVSRAIPIDEYVEDIGRLFRDERFAGLDVYEFFHLARATADGRRLIPIGDRIERIRVKARELGIAAR